ncbi:MAG: hypothetical protein KC731_08530, partial [Myxococcales bacterium]|nr:hypothetical protein [Myxococcales bacterium]
LLLSVACASPPPPAASVDELPAAVPDSGVASGPPSPDRAADVALAAEILGPGEAPVIADPPSEPPPEAVAPPATEPPTPTEGELRLAKAVVRGALTPEVIGRVTRRHLAELRHCFPADAPAGAIDLQVSLTAEGPVQAVRVVRGLRPEIDACLRSAYLRLSFPASDDGGVVVFEQHLTFGPR